MRRAVLGPRCELVCGRTFRAAEQRAHLVQAGVQHVLGLVDAARGSEPPAGTERRPAHDPRRPNVAVHTALVAQPVQGPRLREQLVEALLVLRRDFRADIRDQGLDVRLVGAGRRRPADRTKQLVRHLERRRFGDVEAVEEAVADQVEIGGHGRTGLAVE